MKKDTRSKWSKWKDQHYVPLSRAVSGFGEVEVSPKGIRIQLLKNTPRLRRRTIETLAAEAGSCVSTSTPNLSRDVIFVRMAA